MSKDFVKINLDRFQLDKTFAREVFLHLPANGKMVRIVAVGDQIRPELLEKLQRTGKNYLFARPEAGDPRDQESFPLYRQDPNSASPVEPVTEDNLIATKPPKELSHEAGSRASATGASDLASLIPGEPENGLFQQTFDAASAEGPAENSFSLITQSKENEVSGPTEGQEENPHSADEEDLFGKKRPLKARAEFTPDQQDPSPSGQELGSEQIQKAKLEPVIEEALSSVRLTAESSAPATEEVFAEFRGIEEPDLPIASRKKQSSSLQQLPASSPTPEESLAGQARSRNKSQSVGDEPLDSGPKRAPLDLLEAAEAQSASEGPDVPLKSAIEAKEAIPHLDREEGAGAESGPDGGAGPALRSVFQSQDESLTEHPGRARTFVWESEGALSHRDPEFPLEASTPDGLSLPPGENERSSEPSRKAKLNEHARKAILLKKASLEVVQIAKQLDTAIPEAKASLMGEIDSISAEIERLRRGNALSAELEERFSVDRELEELRIAKDSAGEEDVLLRFHAEAQSASEKQEWVLRELSKLPASALPRTSKMVATYRDIPFVAGKLATFLAHALGYTSQEYLSDVALAAILRFSSVNRERINEEHLSSITKAIFKRQWNDGDSTLTDSLEILDMLDAYLNHPESDKTMKNFSSFMFAKAAEELAKSGRSANAWNDARWRQFVEKGPTIQALSLCSKATARASKISRQILA